MVNSKGPIDFTRLDAPWICQRLFHPRPSLGPPPEPPAEVLSIPTDDNHVLDAVCYTGKDPSIAPVLIFFHGNGEIVDDYASLAPLMTALPAIFIAVEFRGYGRSTGSPNVSAMMADAHRSVAFIDDLLKERNWNGSRVIMGRSLGSAPALAVAAESSRIDGVIIESGFSKGRELLQRLGMGSDLLDGLTDPLFGNAVAIASVPHPTLIIHGVWDQIIPVAQAHDLYADSAADYKELVLIDGADHNSLWAVGSEQYLSAVAAILQVIS